MSRPGKPTGWKQLAVTNIDDPREDRAQFRIEGRLPRRVQVTELLDDLGRRWIDYHDGEGPQPLGGVPDVTSKP